MIENLISQINHLGYKINQDPLRQNTWKIVSPNSNDGLFSLDVSNDVISLYNGENCICQINSEDDPFLILRHLPSNLFTNNTISNKINSIETLYDFCNAKTSQEKSLINAALNSKRIDQFKDRREFAFNVLHILEDCRINVKNKNYDLSIIDIILSIV